MNKNHTMLYKIKKIWFAWVLLIFGLLISILLSLQVKQNHEKDSIEHFSFSADQVTLKIQERLNAYALILKGASALFAASQKVTREEWKTYIHTLNFNDKIEGIGFNQLVLESEFDTHIAQIRSEGFSNYTIFPEGKRDIYTPVVYIEPFDGRNLRAFGFDTYSEPIRQRAMIKAQDTKKPSLTGKIELKQEIGIEVQAGTIMYVPTYRLDNGSLIGWISGVFRMDDLMSNILKDSQQHSIEMIDLEIYDGTEAVSMNLLFNNTKTNLKKIHSPFYQERTIDFNDHQWLLVFDVFPNTFKYDNSDAWTTLIGGFALSFLLFWLLVSSFYIKTNAKRMAKKLTEKLEASEFRWKFAIEGAGDGVWDWNIHTNKSVYSKQWKEMLGYNEIEILPTHTEWENRIHPDDKPLVERTLKAYFENQIPVYSAEFRLKCKDNSYKWILSRGMVVSYDKNGKPYRMLGTHSDIHERKLADKKIENLTEEQNAILNSHIVGIAKLKERQFIWVNQEFAQMHGYTQEELLGQTTRILYPSDEEYIAFGQSVYPSIQQGEIIRSELLNRHKDGSLKWYKIGGGLLHPSGNESIWSFVDITEQKQLENQIHHMAFYDMLTKLPNRRLLSDRLHQAMINSKRSNTYSALMFLDLDNFKLLNDTYGHDIGDLLLIEVAQRLKNSVRELDTVARLGGDEFIMILNDLNQNKEESITQTTLIAEKIRIAISKPYQLHINKNEKIEYDCTASIGIVIFLNHEMEQNEILKWADSAMYKAKINGRNKIQFYE